MFTIEEVFSEMKLPKQYENKVKGWLNNDDKVFSQIKKQVLIIINSKRGSKFFFLFWKKIIKLYNKYMHEEMIYNPVRGKRPQPKESETARN